jgi:hypothetical protein
MSLGPSPGAALPCMLVLAWCVLVLLVAAVSSESARVGMHMRVGGGKSKVLVCE